MKRRVPVLVALVLLATSCRLRPPEISLPEVPAGPLVLALDAQRQRLSGLKAVARVETERRGKRRSFESVAIVMDGHGRLRVDGYGPLGESLFTLLWNGDAVLFRRADDQEFLSVGQAGLERALGVALSPADLTAALGGNVMLPQADDVMVRAGCGQDSRCLIQVPGDRGVRRIYLVRPTGEAARAVAEGEDRYDGGTLVYRGRFEERAVLSGYSFPMLIQLENPDRALRLQIRYEDVELNVPVDEGLFKGEAR